MSTSEEELMALERTKKFLFDLLNPKETPKVPREIRKRASRCLKHYPLLYFHHYSHFYSDKAGKV